MFQAYLANVTGGANSENVRRYTDCDWGHVEVHSRCAEIYADHGMLQNFIRGEARCCPGPCPSCQCATSYTVLRAVLCYLVLSNVLVVVSCAVLCCPLILSCAVLYAHWWSVLAVLFPLWIL